MLLEEDVGGAAHVAGAVLASEKLRPGTSSTTFCTWPGATSTGRQLAGRRLERLEHFLRGRYFGLGSPRASMRPSSPVAGLKDFVSCPIAGRILRKEAGCQAPMAPAADSRG